MEQGMDIPAYGRIGLAYAALAGAGIRDLKGGK